MANSLDALLANEKPDVVRRAQIKADRILLEIRLNEVRALLQKTQKDLAEAMGVTQPTIANMEKAALIAWATGRIDNGQAQPCSLVLLT